MSKDQIEQILVEYGVQFTDALAERLLKEFQTCEDAISRQEVVGYLCAHCPDDAECFDDCDDIKNIKALPSVKPQKLCTNCQVEEKTGHWEWVQYDANPEIGNFHCSECRYMPASFNMSAQKLNYCPHCGAKMKREVTK